MEEITQEVNRILEHRHRMMQNVLSGSTGQHVRLQFDVPGCNREQKELLRELKASTVLGQRDFTGAGGIGVSLSVRGDSVCEGQRMRQ